MKSQWKRIAVALALALGVSACTLSDLERAFECRGAEECSGKFGTVGFLILLATAIAIAGTAHKGHKAGVVGAPGAPAGVPAADG